MQVELKRMQKQLGITFIYVTHDQEEALTMSDTIVVMKDGIIQQIGTPEDIYNEPKNAFVADFIGESNILSGIMKQDFLVEFCNHKFDCVDKGFEINEPVDVVIRPEDIEIFSNDSGKLEGIVESITFKGVHYEMIIKTDSFSFMAHNTNMYPQISKVTIDVAPENIHIMKKAVN